MYKARDLRERTVEDLKELEKSLRSDLFQNRLKNFTNRLDDTSSMKKAKRDLGRVLTVLGEKSRGVTVVTKEKPATPAAPKPAKAPKAKAAPAGAESKPAAKAEKKTTTKRATKSAKSEK